MKVFKIIFLIPLLFISGGNTFAQDTNIQIVKQFFREYVEMRGNYDVSIADLYLDSATIKNLLRFSNGIEESMQLTGSEYKVLFKKVMPAAKERGDKSTFSQINISIDGKRAKIKANRYSNLKCYTDTGYYMIVEQQPDGKYKIVEEYTESQPNSNC